MSTMPQAPRNVAPGGERSNSSSGHRHSAVRDSLAVVASTASIGLLHAALAHSSWRHLLQHLFYLPIIWTGFRHGWLSGLGTALLAAIGLLSGVFWGHIPMDSPALYWEIPVFCAAGILSGVLAGRDRRQKRASEEMARHLARVNQELQENFNRLRRAESLSALGQLAAGLAHEIRNPLASIAGAAGIVRRAHSSPEKTTECLEIIHKECQRLSRLLTSFLDFARPRSPNFLNTSLDSVFDSVLGLAEHATNGASISLRRESAPGLMFDCDPEQLKQVLLNLVINAIQAMPEGGEVLMASHTDSASVIIEVRDQGCGVSPEQMEHLYDPFFTTKENGTGLGLPVAHQIVAHLGGTLSARNNPDRGMTFSVELPLHHQALP